MDTINLLDRCCRQRLGRERDALQFVRSATDHQSPRKRRIVVLRRERGQTRQIPFAYDKLLSDNGESIENFFVMPDDIVLVR